MTIKRNYVTLTNSELVRMCMERDALIESLFEDLEHVQRELRDHTAMMNFFHGPTPYYWPERED